MSLNYQALAKAAHAHHLAVRGAFHPDDLPGVGTLILLGPDEPGFWPAFTASPEYRDGQPDPMDRWSARVIGAWAKQLNAQAFFPFGGPPHAPFFNWATRSGRAWPSPIQLLVHDQAGLFVSYRGALGLADQIPLPDSPSRAPCKDCSQPCTTACPVNAFASGYYDVPACKAHLVSPAGQDCMRHGCAARRACPVSAEFGRLPDHSAFHMRAFL